MENKRTPVIAGLSGAALAVAMFTGGGHSTGDTKAAPAAKVESSSLNEVQYTTNDNGPWYAFCREYTTTGFDHGEDPSDDPGVTGHRMPHEADEGTVEITRPIGRETEKFTVKNHVVGDLPTCVPTGHTLRMIIATVPDPSMTQMELDFDRDIQAIQAAAEAREYAYTRYWYPWRQHDWVPEKGADPDAEVRRRDEPGILCFRKGEARLFVFLVGETPTSGVNRLQLSHALYYWQKLREAKKIAEGDEYRLGLSGPHFSASLPVFEDIFTAAIYSPAAQAPEAPILDLVSPDVSGQEPIKDFSAYCNLQVPKWGAAPCILHALSIKSNIADWFAIDYLASLHYDSKHTALLEEDESAFSVGRFPTPSKTEPAYGLRTEPPYGLRLRFPRDLSSLRSLSDLQSEQIAESGSKYLSLSQGSPLARLTARQPTERDTPESYATEQEAAEAARVLADDVEEMRSRHIQAVVVTATNPLDRVYLLEYLHDQLPELRTVTIEADELELGSPHFIDLTGTIAVTALPTLPELVAGDNSESHLSFRSSRQQGEFLAVKALLDPDRDPQIGEVFDEDLTPCYTISIVGQSGFRLMSYGSRSGDTANPKFPCSVSASSGQKTFPGTFSTVKENADVPNSFLTFLFVVVLFNASHLWSCLNSLRPIEGILSYPRQLGPQLEPRRLYLLFAVNNQLFLLNLLAWRAAHTLWSSPMSGGSHGIWFALLYSAFYALLSVSAVLSVVFSIGFFKQPIGLLDKVQFAIATLYLLTTGLMICSLLHFLPKSYVFLERFALLGEGLSPLLPITGILVAYFFWGSMQLKRLEWIYCRRIDLGQQLALNNDMNTRFETAMKRAEAAFPEEGMISVVGLMVCIFGAFLLWKSLKGFDGPYFHIWFVFWGFIALLWTVILTCYQAWSIWDGLRKLLEWLEMTPVREAFQKIGDDGVVKINIWDFTNQRRSFTVLDATAQSIERIYGSASAQANSARSKLDDFISADLKKAQVETDEIQKLNDLLNVHMAGAMQSLASRPMADYTPQSQIYLALRLVAFVRYAMLQIMTLLGFVASGYVLAALSVMFYPFAGRKTLAELLTLTFVGLLILLGSMMVQFGKNSMLSRLEGSTPGEVSYWQVALHLLTVGGLPLLAVATTQFPALGQFVFSLLRPVLGALH